MISSLGIVTPWVRCEASQSALRIADWAAHRGLDVSILPCGPQRPLRRRWDVVAAASRGLSFSDWLPGKAAVLWTCCPSPEQLRQCRQASVKTLLLVLPHELTPAHAAAMSAVDLALAPTREAAMLASRRWNARAVLTAPWDTGLPWTCKDPRLEAGRRLLLPLFDESPSQVEFTALTVAARAVDRFPDAQLTVAYSPSRLASRAKRSLVDLRRRYGPRVQEVRSPSFEQRPPLYRDHDLTLWPVCQASTGHCGLESLAMGTPVLAFRFSPLPEFLTRRNSLLAPGALASDSQGMRCAVPNYEALDAALQSLLERPGRLAELQGGVLDGLRPRRAAFDAALSQALD